MAFALVIAATIAFSGCGGHVPKPKGEEQREPGAPEDLIALSIGYNHMTRFCPFDFELKDKGGEIFFSCFYYDWDNDYEEVRIEDALVEPEYMDRVREIVKQYGFVHMRYREPGKIAQMTSDAPMYSLRMSWPEGNNLRLNYWPGGAEELEEIFRGLAKEHITNTKEEEINNGII